MSEDLSQATTRLCIDGPAAGRWMTMSGEYLRMPKDPPPIVEVYDENYVPEMTFDVVEYRASRLKFSGETRTLPVWVSGDMDIDRIMSCIRNLRKEGRV